MPSVRISGPAIRYGQRSTIFEGDQTYSEKRGHKFSLNATFDEIRADDYDAVVICVKWRTQWTQAEFRKSKAAQFAETIRTCVRTIRTRIGWRRSDRDGHRSRVSEGALGVDFRAIQG